MFLILSEKSCRIVLPEKVNARYRFVTLLKKKFFAGFFKLLYQHSRKKTDGELRTGISKGFEKTMQKFQNQLKKKWIF